MEHVQRGEKNPDFEKLERNSRKYFLVPEMKTSKGFKKFLFPSFGIIKVLKKSARLEYHMTPHTCQLYSSK